MDQMDTFSLKELSLDASWPMPLLMVVFIICTENRINAGLISPALLPEPIQHV